MSTNESAGTRKSLLGKLHGFAVSLASICRRHQVALAIITMAFAARFYLSGQRSYWLDEVYSVYVHAVQPDSFAGVLETMWGIIHPPLYQLTLYPWVQLLGHSEIATRTLSNIYMGVATLVLYLFTLRGFGRGPAIAAAALFSLSATAMYYGHETRSYAMVMMWACASSYAAAIYVRDQLPDFTWRSAFLSPSGFALASLNTAALFTHYYLAFFIAAQGLFLFVLLVLVHRGWKRPLALVRLGLFGAIPPGILVLLWGGSLMRRYERGGREFNQEPQTMLDLWNQLVVEPNLGGGNLIGALIILCGLLSLGWMIWLSLRKRKLSEQAIFALCTLNWLVLSITIATFSILAAGQNALAARYFLYVAPALMIVLAVGIWGGIRVFSWGMERIGCLSSRTSRQLAFFPALSVAALVLVMPATQHELMRERLDWRQLAHVLERQIRSDRDHSYFILEVASRPYSVMDYYYERENLRIRTNAVIHRHRYRRGPLPLDQASSVAFDQADYIIVVFPHIRLRLFTNVLEELNRQFDEEQRVMLVPNRGYIVYKRKIDIPGE